MMESDFLKNDMNQHEEFEELCSLAAGGFASAADLARLESHLENCSLCLKFFQDMTEMTSLLRLRAEAIFIDATENVLAVSNKG